MRILVYGAGVQGCQLAHSLAQNKKNVVTLLAPVSYTHLTLPTTSRV